MVNQYKQRSKHTKSKKTHKHTKQIQKLLNNTQTIRKQIKRYQTHTTKIPNILKRKKYRKIPNICKTIKTYQKNNQHQTILNKYKT